MTFDKSLFQGLTIRETEILQGLADRLGTAELAAQQKTTEQTIKNYIYRSCQKTGSDNRTIS